MTIGHSRAPHSDAAHLSAVEPPLTPQQYDVAIIGGGLAGNLLARQLRRQLPEQRVAVFERQTHSAFKVGESTVELASNYLVRRLGLSRYLYEHQLPKNGLRFFFDNAERSAELFEMSEMGTSGLPLIPSFQLDRSRLESFLIDDNRSAGVTLLRGVRVRNVDLSSDGAPHRFDVQRGEQRVPMQARWLIDASGRAGVLARKLKLRVPEHHQVSAVWGRFSSLADLDDIGPAAFRERVKHTSRVLSTTHFCYPGYWIWLIPLGQGITSVGVVMERDRFNDEWRSEAGFVGFLKQHRALAMLLEKAELLDVMSYTRAAYGCRQYFGDRWAVIGEAASFSDPLYSPGSDFIALENDFVVDLIRRQSAGESAAEYAEQAKLYDEFMRYRYEGTMRLYRGLYSLLGSFELFRLKWDFDIACYYNLWLEPYLADKHLDASYLRRLLQQQSMEMAALETFASLFAETEAALRQRGDYYTSNSGRYVGEFEAIDASPTLGSAASLRAALRRTLGSFNRVRSRAFTQLYPQRPPPAPLPMSHFLRGKSLSL